MCQAALSIVAILQTFAFGYIQRFVHCDNDIRNTYLVHISGQHISATGSGVRSSYPSPLRSLR